MTDPYDVLGLSAQASDAEIRGRYLELVRQFPPDRAPERFAQVRAAFDELRDPIERLQRQLFSLQTKDSLEALAADLRQRLQAARLGVDVLLALAEPR